MKTVKQAYIDQITQGLTNQEGVKRLIMMVLKKTEEQVIKDCETLYGYHWKVKLNVHPHYDRE